MNTTVMSGVYARTTSPYSQAIMVVEYPGWPAFSTSYWSPSAAWTPSATVLPSSTPQPNTVLSPISATRVRPGDRAVGTAVLSPSAFVVIRNSCPSRGPLVLRPSKLALTLHWPRSSTRYAGRTPAIRRASSAINSSSAANVVPKAARRRMERF